MIKSTNRKNLTGDRTEYFNKTDAAYLLGISRVTLSKYENLNRIQPVWHPLYGCYVYTEEILLEALNKVISKPKSKFQGEIKTDVSFTTSFLDRREQLKQRKQNRNP